MNGYVFPATWSNDRSKKKKEIKTQNHLIELINGSSVDGPQQQDTIRSDCKHLNSDFQPSKQYGDMWVSPFPPF